MVYLAHNPTGFKGGWLMAEGQPFMVAEDTQSNQRETDKPLSVPYVVPRIRGLGWFQTNQWTNSVLTHLNPSILSPSITR